MLLLMVVPARRRAPRPSSCVQPIPVLNWHVRHMNTLWIIFLRHAFCEAGFGMACHCKGTALRKALERCACIREDDRSPRAICVRFVLAPELGLPCRATHKSCALRRVPKCVQHHAWVGFGNRLAKDAGNPPIDVMHDQRRTPEVSRNVLKKAAAPRKLAHLRRKCIDNICGSSPSSPDPCDQHAVLCGTAARNWS